MDENTKQNFINEAENEVVLEYTAEPKPYVAYYVQPTPMPGKRAAAQREETIAEESTAKPRKKHKGLKIFLVLLTALLIICGALGACWYFGLLPNLPFNGDFHYYYYYGENELPSAPTDHSTEEPRLPKAALAEGVRLTYNETRGAVLTAQEIYTKVNPSTVIVAAEMPKHSGLSVGTGIIFTSDGYLLTNAHVLAGSVSCTVVLYDGTMYDAKLVGCDMEKDIAVIKVEATDLPAAEFGDSDALNVGDKVYAIGNPLGIELYGTLTDGIVSAINRDVQVSGVTMTLIQTNAALNNGNSGGPLINEYGQVVGINTMKMGGSQFSTASVEGLGFAIPIASSAYMVNDLLRYGEIHGEPVLGISVDRSEFYLPTGEKVLRVYSVTTGGPGDAAGVQTDDFIVCADGERVETTEDLLRIRRRHDVGEGVVLELERSGERFEVTVVLAEDN